MTESDVAPERGGAVDTTAPADGLPLLRLAQVSTETAATSSRLKKRDLIAGLLREATTAEVALVAGYLTGAPRQRRTGIGWRAVASPPEPATAPSLTVLDVDARLDAISRLGGSGSVAVRAHAVADLFELATAPEQAFLRALITGELRQGALDGVMLDAVSQAFAVPAALVRRAAMLSGSTPRTGPDPRWGRPADLPIPSAYFTPVVASLHAARPAGSKRIPL